MQKGSIMNKKEKNNIDSKSTITTNTIPSKDTLSHISQKQIADKVNNSISEFIVISNSDTTVQDWIFKPKFLEIADGLGDTSLDYPLKRTIQGNADEGRKLQKGKALRVAVDKDMVIISVYTQSYGEAWELSHTHNIDKVVFDAYALVVKNDLAVAKVEKDMKSPENFSLNLG